MKTRCQSGIHVQALSPGAPRSVATWWKHAFFGRAAGHKGKVVVNEEARRRDQLAFFASPARWWVDVGACGAAHHWRRALTSVGYDVQLIPPTYVKPYVKRQKYDATDAAPNVKP